ncbi:MAG: hybrid sensor histidine kinase/response regulator [Gammaproteobacteria bacterium]|nr:MAG: hybrid sensor histidine kinase/response regulator [Gammaproteobacteria bacterium]RKZ76254.1 MAG: hybrid sensor histidine kinase/response regulator [Gammaproteobacteria bacterium]
MTNNQIKTPKGNILVVDDTPENLYLLITMLSEQGYEVRSANSGVQALSAVRSNSPDLILLDITMPGMDGYETCKCLKANELTRDIPIIFISALNETFGKIKAFSVGGVDYITKPFQAKEVLVRVVTHINLRHVQKQLEAKNVILQQEVAERKRAEEALQKTLTELHSTQFQLIQAEKLAALGQLIAGIAHEINTPLGAIRASIDNILASYRDMVASLPQLAESIFTQANRLKLFMGLLEKASTIKTNLTSKEKRTLKRQLRQKLSSEHIEGASTLADTLIYMKIGEYLEDLLPWLKDKEAISIAKTARNFVSIQNNSSNITLAVDKASKVVFALRKFAHHDTSGEKAELDLIDSIETVLTLYYNQIKQGTEVIKQYQKLPLVWCYTDEVHQVWTNIIHNALQAMDYKGKLTLKTVYSQDQVIISFTDTGCGIPENIKERIFEPFFTTKGRGEGSGLGLDIVKKIIDKHHGKIEIESEVGKGTTFQIFLNVK